MNEFITALLDNNLFRAFLGVLFTTIIQISPIKLNPWTALAKFFGIGNSKKILEELSGMKQEQSALTKEISFIKNEQLPLIKDSQHGIEAAQQALKENILEVNSQISSIKETEGRTQAENSRMRILRFNDESLHNVNHSKEHFEQIIMDIEKYDAYCDAHPDFKNHITKVSSKRILEDYEQKLESHTFLGEEENG